MSDVIAVRYLVLCDYADNAKAKHFISGAGLSNIPVPAQGPESTVLILPTFAIALAIDVPYLVASGKHSARVRIEDSDGQPILPQPIEAQFEPSRPLGMGPDNWQTHKMSFNILGLRFPREGIYSVVVDIDGAESARQSVHIMKRSSNTATGRVG
jgi:hypothetical protein